MKSVSGFERTIAFLTSVLQNRRRFGRFVLLVVVIGHSFPALPPITVYMYFGGEAKNSSLLPRNEKGA